MPARVFRYTLQNTITGHTMRLEAHSLCGGCWTPGGWRPPDSIASGARGGWQSESCGIMTGTQGWVKYRLNRDSDGANRGLVYVYWTNPYLGVTRGKWGIAGQNIVADCDEDAPGAGSSFAAETGENARPSDLFLDPVAARKNGEPVVLDSLKDMLHLPMAPFVIFLAAGIYERMEIDLRLRSSSTPSLLPTPGVKTSTVETRPQPASFVGTWTGQSLSVSVALTGFRQFQVQVSDRTQPVPLELNVSASLGLGTVAHPIDEFINTELLRRDGTDRTEMIRAAAALGAMSASLRSLEDQPAGSASWSLTSTRHVPEASARELTRTAIQKRAVSAGIEQSTELSTVAAAVAEIAQTAKYMIHLGQGIALYLVRIEEDGRFASYRLHYQRLTEDGQVLVDVDLTYLIRVH